MVFNLNDFKKCFRTTHEGQRCKDKKCIIDLSNKEFAELLADTLREGKKWEGTK